MKFKAVSLLHAAGTVALLTVSFFSSGCRTIPAGPFRTREELSREEVVDALYQNTLHFTTLTDTRISLRVVEETDRGRQRYPSVGGILVFDKMFPGLWLRAEKFGQNVFSLRAHAGGFWLEIPDSREIITGTEAAYEHIPHLVQPGEIMLWFAPPELMGLTWESTKMNTSRHEYLFDVRLNGYSLRRVAVNRRDLTIRSITSYDVLGLVDTVVSMDRYGSVNGSVFPHRIVVCRPRAGYELTLRFSSPRFDREFDRERAFLPPAGRSGWKHIDLDR